MSHSAATGQGMVREKSWNFILSLGKSFFQEKSGIIDIKGMLWMNDWKGGL